MVTKICVGNYVGDIYRHAKFYPNRFQRRNSHPGSPGAPGGPQRAGGPRPGQGKFFLFTFRLVIKRIKKYKNTKFHVWLRKRSKTVHLSPRNNSIIIKNRYTDIMKVLSRISLESTNSIGEQWCKRATKTNGYMRVYSVCGCLGACSGSH